MSFTTKEDLLKKWENAESRAEAKEIAAIKKDISTARGVIGEALARYKKTKLRAKSKKAAQEDPFAELADYSSRKDIQDAYGWEFITEAKMDQLLALWDLRENGMSKAGEFRDRVTDMLELALRGVGDEYMDMLDAYAEKQRDKEWQAEEIARENNEREWQRKNGRSAD